MEERIPLYNSRITRVYMEYLEKFYPGLDRNALLEYAGIRPFELEDPGCWLTQQQVDRFHEAMDRELGASNIPRMVGRFASESSSVGILRRFALGFMSPSQAYKATDKFVHKLTRATVFSCRQVAGNQAEITVSTKAGVKEKPFQCENRKGMLEAMARVFTREYPEIEHPSCIHRGDDCCRYLITWKRSPALLWKRLRGLSIVLNILAPAAFLLLLPPPAWVYVLVGCTVLTLALTSRCEYLQKEDLRKNIQCQADVAGDYLEETNKRHSSTLMVQEIGKASSEIHKMDALLDAVARIMAFHLDFETGVILVPNREGTGLVFGAGYGLDPEAENTLRQAELPLSTKESENLFAEVYHTHEPRVVDIVPDGEDKLGADGRRYAGLMKSRSLICVPIIYESRSIGILAVGSNEPKSVVPGDLNTLMGIASQTALSMANTVSFQKLQQSEERYRNILDSIEDGYFEVDLRGDFTFFNHSLCRISGYSAEELAGMNNRRYMDEANAKKVFQVFNRVYSTGEPRRGFDWEIVRKDGTRRQVDASVSLIRDAAGEKVGFRGIVRDISDRRKAEEALRESEKKYRKVLESIEEGYYEVDLRGNHVFFNDALCRMYGCSRAELTGLNFRNLHDKENSEKIFQVYNNLYKSGKPIRGLEWEINRRDGTQRYIEVSASLIRDAQGEPAGFQGMVRDVTDRKRAEEALTEEKERFRILVEESPLGISIIGRDGAYKYFNPKFTEIFGYTLEDVPTGREWFARAFPDPETRREAVSAWKEDLERSYTGESRQRIYRTRCKDGTEKVVHFRPVTTQKMDQFVIYEDITEQKRLEAQLQQAQRMESLGTLAGGIAHDFNNLLMGIQGNASLMLLEMDPKLPGHERLKSIEEYVRNGAELTRQLLGFARGGKYEAKPTDLNALVMRSAELFGRTKKEITIHARYEEKIWPVEVDRGQIEQVLLNLFVNAWQAMPGGGELYLETRNVELNRPHVVPYSMKPGNYVKISVTDTGTGMDEKTQARIFDPFFTTKGMGRGTGLGLASVYGIVKNHGGNVSVYSKKGHGATFNIYLPASDKPLIPEEPRKEGIRRGSETLLLVDDEEMIIAVGSKLMESLGYRVFTAGGGEEAIEIYRQHSHEIDLVLLDMIMPEVGGGETYDRLKEIDPGVKVLLSSGYSMNGQAKKIMQRGCNGFIQKPFTIKELSDKIRGVLDETCPPCSG